MIIVCVLVKLNKSKHHICFSGIDGLFFTFCVLIIICGLYLFNFFQCLDCGDWTIGFWSVDAVLGFDSWAVLFRFCYYFLLVVLNVVFFGQSLMRTKCFSFFIFVSNLVPTPKIF